MHLIACHVLRFIGGSDWFGSSLGKYHGHRTLLPEMASKLKKGHEMEYGSANSTV